MFEMVIIENEKYCTLKKDVLEDADEVINLILGAIYSGPVILL